MSYKSNHVVFDYSFSANDNLIDNTYRVSTCDTMKKASGTYYMISGGERTITFRSLDVARKFSSTATIVTYTTIDDCILT
jgi:hypothetical protein